MIFIVTHVLFVFTIGLRANLNHIYGGRDDDNGAACRCIRSSTRGVCHTVLTQNMIAVTACDAVRTGTRKAILNPSWSGWSCTRKHVDGESGIETLINEVLARHVRKDVA